MNSGKKKYSLTLKQRANGMLGNKKKSLSQSPTVKPYFHSSVSSFSRWSLKLRLRSPRGSYSGLNAPPKPLASSSRLSSLSGASGFSGSSPSNQTETKVTDCAWIWVRSEISDSPECTTRRRRHRFCLTVSPSQSSRSPLLCSSKAHHREPLFHSSKDINHGVSMVVDWLLLTAFGVDLGFEDNPLCRCLLLSRRTYQMPHRSSVQGVSLLLLSFNSLLPNLQRIALCNLVVSIASYVSPELIRANIFVVCCDSLGFVSSASSSSGAPGCGPDAPSMPAWSHFGECSIKLVFMLFSCFLISSPEQEALRIGSLVCCLLSFNVY
ncbi:hypothetical protein HID58_042272 [Brassica napus]|uniref:Uncharacterized protein n=1 Tax=Brassica napus TaxID=3708 RepID=A0ABQ8BDA2_BRANA|nr:hypothetical protein HID58_042272 [Brassica napus]